MLGGSGGSRGESETGIVQGLDLKHSGADAGFVKGGGGLIAQLNAAEGLHTVEVAVKSLKMMRIKADFPTVAVILHRGNLQWHITYESVNQRTTKQTSSHRERSRLPLNTGQRWTVPPKFTPPKFHLVQQEAITYAVVRICVKLS